VKLLLDTNRLTDVLAGDAALVDTVEEASEVWIPFVALAEIKAGFVSGNRAGENEAVLQRFLRADGVGILFADRETTDVYARLYSFLRRSGTPVPTNDLWIASLAVQHHLVLLTRDEDFSKLPQVARG
jgi:tRNA(fMet)-specific endonuclease VapC